MFEGLQCRAAGPGRYTRKNVQSSAITIGAHMVQT